jgi:ligand-binding sensor domain-containing protein
MKNGQRKRKIHLCNFILLVFFCVFLIPYTAVCQNPSVKFTHLTVQNGLSINTVNCIYQDSKGFMWFGTKEGLNKYNGYTYTHYRHNPKDDNSISNNRIWVIYEDKQQNLWVGTEDGLNQLNKETATFTRFKHDPSDPNSISENVVISMYEDEFNNLWIGTRSNSRRSGE